MAVASQFEMQVVAAVLLQLYGVNPHFPSELQQLASAHGEVGLHWAGAPLSLKGTKVERSERRVEPGVAVDPPAMVAFSASVAFSPH
jgi:uncharacterized protein (AIM24 family)